MKLSWNILSKYRNELFGVSILWIILFHMVTLTHIKLPYYFKDFYPFLAQGNIGVEIFLLLSGLGLYYSFSRNGNIVRFYKRRFKRIFFSYIIISGSFFLYTDILVKKSVVKFFSDLIFLSFYGEGNRTVWFVALIVPLYILFPLIYNYLINVRYETVKIVLIILALYLFLFLLKTSHFKEYVKLEIALTRIPIFLVGCYLGKLAKTDCRISSLQRFLIFLSLVGGFCCFGHRAFVLMNWHAMRIMTFTFGIAFPFFFILILSFFEM